MEITPKLTVLDEKERESILKRFRRKTIMEHLMGPVGSVLFHILVIVLAVNFMVFKAVEKQADIEVMVVEPDAVELDKFKEELEKIEDLPDMTDMVAPNDIQMNVDAPAPTEAPGPQTQNDMNLADLNVLSDSSPLVMKGLFAGRTTGGRAASLKQYGGKYGEMTERSVIRALEWLKRNQLADGSWGPQEKQAMTGLGLLTFLAHGETTSSKDYGPTVEKAIRFLVSSQKDDGIFTGYTQPGVYAHAIATYAISEAYGLTRIPDLKNVMEKAAAVIVRGQQAGGLWDYSYKKEARWDVSVAGWQIQAMKAAYIAGADVPGLHEAMLKAADGLKNAQSEETGEFGYSQRGHQPGHEAMTGVAVLCLQMLGFSKDAAVRKGVTALKGSTCVWQDPPNWPMYSWYYTTQAKFHEGGNDWSAWNNMVAPELAKNQNEDGSWTAAVNPKSGKSEESSRGPVYSTTLAALTLQVYYRFLPTYKPIAVEGGEEKPKDDVSIEII